MDLDPEKEEAQTAACTLDELTPGHILDQDVFAITGSLIVARGQEVTPALIVKLKNFQARGALSGKITVFIPRGRSSYKAAGAK